MKRQLKPYALPLNSTFKNWKQNEKKRKKMEKQQNKDFKNIDYGEILDYKGKEKDPIELKAKKEAKECQEKNKL